MQTTSTFAARPVGALKSVARRAGVTRARVASLRMCCERNAIARMRTATGRPRSRILCYHSIGTPEWGVNDVSPVRFRQQIESALHAGFTFVPAERIARREGLPTELAITFDDGLASVGNALPVLDAYRIPYTLFIVSQWADGVNPSFPAGKFLDWRAIETLCAGGASIGSHSVTHPNFGHLTPAQAEEELCQSRATIGHRLGIQPGTFAIPFGQSHDWNAGTAAQARAAGYETIYAQSEHRRPDGTIPRTFITHWDTVPVFRAALSGKFDRWEEWV